MVQAARETPSHKLTTSPPLLTCHPLSLSRVLGPLRPKIQSLAQDLAELAFPIPAVLKRSPDLYRYVEERGTSPGSSRSDLAVDLSPHLDPATAQQQGLSVALTPGSTQAMVRAGAVPELVLRERWLRSHPVAAEDLGALWTRVAGLHTAPDHPKVT